MLDQPHLILYRYTVSVKCCCYKFNYCETDVASCDDCLLLASCARHVACMGVKGISGNCRNVQWNRLQLYKHVRDDTNQ
jgi:hypothetical protein